MSDESKRANRADLKILHQCYSGGVSVDTPQVREQAVVRQALELGDHVKLEYDDDGWESRVYLVNRGEAVFKFPRSHAAKIQYRREIRILDALQTIDGPILIPRVQWRRPDIEWFGYRGIVGQQLSYALPDLDVNTKRSIGRSLGFFSAGASHTPHPWPASRIS